MASVLSDIFVRDTMDSFFESFTTNDFYLFVSSAFDGSEVVNSQYSTNLALRQTIFGKKILPEDVLYSIKENTWEPNVVYQIYDDRIDLSTTNFYVVLGSDTSASGDYEVYKCLSNNNGAKSLVAPVYNQDIEDQIYRTSDGYIWKYMYQITEQEYEKYSSDGYVPVFIPEPSANAEPIINSTVSSFSVENLAENRGYSNVVGDIDEVQAVNIILSGASLNRYNNFYNGQTLYVTETNNISKLYNIATYSFNTLTNKATVTLTDKDAFITDTCTYSILPKVVVTGDGTGALAYPRIEEGVVKEIIVLDPGQGYTMAQAVVVDPLYSFDPVLSTSNYNTALIRPILSPPGGHASNITAELFANKILIYTGITETDNLTAPTLNSFSKVCIVKNPEFNSNTAPVIFDNRLSVELSTSSPTSIGETVLQRLDGAVTFEGIIHQKVGNTLLLTDYVGPYTPNPSYGDISISAARQIEIETTQLFSINSIVTSQYIQGTGEVIYATSFNSINRTIASREQFKVAIEF